MCFSEAFSLPVTTLIPTAQHFHMCSERQTLFPGREKLFLESHKLKSPTTQGCAIEHAATTKALGFPECVSVICHLFARTCWLPDTWFWRHTNTWPRLLLRKPVAQRRNSLSLIATRFSLCPYIPTLCCRSKNHWGQSQGIGSKF